MALIALGTSICLSAQQIVSEEIIATPDCTLQDCKTDEGYVIRVIGSGENVLRDAADTEDAHAKNRRVEISGELKQQVQTLAPKDPASAELSGRFVV